MIDERPPYNDSKTTYPSLSALSLKPLRSERHSNLKNELMMSMLSRQAWFLEYRRALAHYRRAGRPHDEAPPAYPSTLVEMVEQRVDEYIRTTIDPQYTR